MIVLIAVLAGMVAPNVFKRVGDAKSVTARSQIEMLGARSTGIGSITAGTRPRGELNAMLEGARAFDRLCAGLPGAAAAGESTPLTDVLTEYFNNSKYW